MFKIQAPLVVQSPGIHQSLRAGLMTEKPVLTIRLLNTYSVRFDDREIEVINKPRLQTDNTHLSPHRVWAPVTKGR